MSTFSIRILVIITAVMITLSSCMGPENQSVSTDPAFGNYISAYTSGVVARKDQIVVILAKEYNGKFMDNKELASLFEFEPSLEGTAVWENKRTIRFIPSKPLPVSTHYITGFQLHKVADVPNKYKEFRFQFTVKNQQLQVNIEGPETYDAYNYEWQHLNGNVTVSDWADTAEIHQTLKASQEGRPLRVSWGYASGNRHYFEIDSVKRGAAESKVVVEYDGKPVGDPNSGKLESRVPGMGDFSISNDNLKQNPDQVIELHFSDPLLAGQNLDGIVRLQGVDQLSFQIEGHALYVFLTERITGNRVLTISTGLKNAKGYKMNEPQEREYSFEPPKPMIRLVGKGNILPHSGNLLFPFEVIGMKAVDVRISRIHEKNVAQFLQVNSIDGDEELRRVASKLVETKVDLEKGKKLNLNAWNRFTIDIAKYIRPEPGAIYRVELKMRKEYAACDCSGEEENTGENNGWFGGREDDEWFDTRNKDFYNYYDNEFYSYESDYYDQYSPCSRDYYHGRARGRNILASDLGIIAKIGNDRVANVFVSSLVDTRPMAGTTIEFLNYQQEVITSGVTDATGMLSINLPKKPFLLVAKSGDQRGYMKMEDSYSNSLSKFDVSGEDVQQGIKGYIYGERGVWRPGDSIYIAFLLEDKQKTLPTNHPVTFELVSPRGETAHKITRTSSLNGMYAFRTATDPNAITGNWLARVTVGKKTYTRSLKVETIKPNRLKIYLDFGKERISSTDKTQQGQLTVKWLHGALAKNMKAQVDVNVTGGSTTFPKYIGYVFDSPVRFYNSNTETVFNGTVDDKGNASFPLSLKIAENAPGKLKAFFTTKVFEEGGEFSVDRHSVEVSPFSSYVGMRFPESRLFGGMLETGETHTIEVATVDENGNPVNRKGVNIRVYNIGWRWWWDHQDEDLGGYLSRTSTVAVKDTALVTANGKGIFKLKLGHSHWGRYLVVATDPVSGHSCGKVVYVDAPWWSKSNKNNNENASMLNFSTDKDKYFTGETIKVTIPSASGNRLLVCLETGSKVISRSWVETTEGETRIEIPATKEMLPNIFVHVTLMQPHARTKTDLPIRLYGVLPVMVEDPSTHLDPVLTTKDVWKPEEKATVMVKEKNGKPMTYTLAVVDDGLLDLTKYKTPAPWNTFYAREALGVKTWDLFDQVMASQYGKVDKMLSIGGDGMEEEGNNAKANRFKPMVRFIGPFYVAPGETKSHTLDIPNYVGSVRVMVVAGHNGAYGSADKTVAVRTPLMVLATLPRVLGPQETVELPVNVFAMEKQVKNVKVRVEVNSLFTLEGSSTQELTFKDIGDEVINFKMKVAPKTGLGSVRVIAESGSEKSVSEIEIDVRTPNPEVTDIDEIVLEPGKSWSLDYSFTGMGGTNKGVLEISSVPPMDLEKRLQYLMMYPHGCIEQTTSSVFPQLLVGNLLELTTKEKDQITKNVKAGIKRIQLFQTGAGGFSYWPGESYTSEWGSNYAGHFLMEAEKLGYSVPASMKNRWVKYQTRAAKDWTGTNNKYSHPHGSESYQLIQAYRLYTLALAKQPEMGSMNRMREMPNLSTESRWRLAAAYQLVGQDEVARNMVKGLNWLVKPYKELSYSYGSDYRDRAMILETLSLLQEMNGAKTLADEVAKSLSSDQWMSTQETAYGLIAMIKYVSGNGTTPVISAGYSLNGAGEQSFTSSTPVKHVRMEGKDLIKNGKLQLRNTGTSVLYVKMIRRGIPLIGDPSAFSNHVKISVRYTDIKGNPIDVKKLSQGTDFIAEVKVDHAGTKGNLNEMALNQIFPSGWEIHNARMDEFSTGNSGYTYQDVRDDRVYTYYNLQKNGTKTFKIRLNATYLGKFYLPTVETEAMYDNTIAARVPGMWVEVVRGSGLVGR
ncbi:MAG: hypothetical protein IT233_02700 [Bacteroidia bacterium]|nr:hypothetical protein [Bacteroidia bacterium]